VSNARAIVALWEAGNTLDALLWAFSSDLPIRRSLSEVPAETPTSRALGPLVP
jgi:3-methyladenine DNA glycosylase Tag